LRRRISCCTGLVLTVIALALVMLLGTAYWHRLGYV
jgi:hypothetical protein